jgi:hypothetical protein
MVAGLPKGEWSDMNDNVYDIVLITDSDLLIEFKENLKKDILDPNLKWNERMDLYLVIKNINERIKYLKE